MAIELANYEAAMLIVGSIALTLFFLWFVWPRVRLTSTPIPESVQQYSTDFVNYVRRGATWISILTLFALLIWGMMVYLDLTTSKVALWLGGGGAILLLVMSKVPEAENLIAAMTVFWRRQVFPGEEFEITYSGAKFKEELTLVGRDERFSYARNFAGSRSLAMIPHTIWIDSIVSNITRQGTVRWIIKVPLDLKKLSARSEVLDLVDEYCVESGFSNVVPDQVPYNYQTKLLPRLWGHFPVQTLLIYTYVNTREYGFDNENGFLDGVYKIIENVKGVEIAEFNA